MITAVTGLDESLRLEIGALRDITSLHGQLAHLDQRLPGNTGATPDLLS